MDRFRIAVTIVAALIAVNTALLGLAAQTPPTVPIPPLAVVLAVLANAALAVIQTQMPSWRDTGRASAAIDRMPPTPPAPPRG